MWEDALLTGSSEGGEGWSVGYDPVSASSVSAPTRFSGHLRQKLLSSWLLGNTAVHGAWGSLQGGTGCEAGLGRLLG